MIYLIGKKEVGKKWPSVKSDQILTRWLILFPDQSFLPTFFYWPTIMADFFLFLFLFFFGD